MIDVNVCQRFPENATSSSSDLVLLFCSRRPRWRHADRCGERPSQVSPPRRKAGSELPGPGFGHRHTLFSAASEGSCEWLARRSGGNAQDNAGLPSGGEVRHAGGRGVYAQTRPEWDGDAEGQPHLGVRKYHTGEQRLSDRRLYPVSPVTRPESTFVIWSQTQSRNRSCVSRLSKLPALCVVSLVRLRSSAALQRRPERQRRQEQTS